MEPERFPELRVVDGLLILLRVEDEDPEPGLTVREGESYRVPVPGLVILVAFPELDLTPVRVFDAVP